MFNVNKGLEHWPKALLHYKTTPFFDPMSAVEYVHTNSWEILELSRILTRMGYRVNVVDRSEREWIPADDYSLVIGNASGNSGQRYPVYCEATPSAHHLLFATGPNPDVADRLVIERYVALEARSGRSATPMRVMDKIDISRNLSLSDSVVTIDGNGFTRSTYEGSGLPVETFTPSTSPSLSYDPSWIDSRDLDSFLCFAGNGFIAKGVDIVVECFLKLPEYNVTIAGPADDLDFWEIYGDRISQAPNIRFVGFLDVNGSEYAELIRTHAWSLLPAAAEGVCTSVATTMRGGLVPVVTRETSVNTGDFGTLIPSDTEEMVDNLVDIVSGLASTNMDEYRRRVEATVEASNAYTQEAFSISVERAFRNILQTVSGE